MAEETIIQTARFLNNVVEILFPYVLLLKNIVVQFWWVALPFFLYKYFFRFAFVLFMETKWNKSFKRVVLEVKVPQHVNRPLKAMENFFPLSGLFTTLLRTGEQHFLKAKQCQVFLLK